jgi:hypothetical protein
MLIAKCSCGKVLEHIECDEEGVTFRYCDECFQKAKAEWEAYAEDMDKEGDDG